MTWVVVYEPPAHTPSSRGTWLREPHPSREDALTACDAILHNGGVVESVVETLDDGSVAHRLDHRDVLRELDVRYD
jgi:hypothetical protein